MNLDLKEMTAVFKRVFTRVPTGREGSIFLYRDWQRLIVTLIVAGILVVMFAVYTFYQISSGTFALGDSASGTRIDVLSREKLGSVIDSFAKKEAEFSARKNQKPTAPNL